MFKYLDYAIKKDEENEKLTFGELKKGDWFIGVPMPADYNGNRGYKGAHYLYIKSDKWMRRRDLGYANRLCDDVESTFPNSMEVIHVWKSSL